MKNLFFTGLTLGIVFFLIAFTLNDYQRRNNDIKENKIAESIEQAERERFAQNSETNMWDRVHGIKEKLQTTVPHEAEELKFSEITNEDGEICGYQQIENIEYDEDGNIISFDTVGDIISVEAYNEIRASLTAAVTTKRKIPDIRKKQETNFRITVR